MNANSDWTAVREQMMDGERRKLGAPPTAEEIEAYARGELPPDEEERVRALLVCYPDLARTLLQPAEAGGEALAAEDIAADWKTLQKRIHREEAGGGGNVLLFWRVSAAIAATIALVFGGLLWRARSDLGQPRLTTAEYRLTPEISRGRPADDEPAVALDSDQVLFSGEVSDHARFDHYRLELVSVAPAARRLWSSPAFRVAEDNPYFSVLVPRSRLEPGHRYRMILYGAGGGREESLETYSIRVAR